MQVKPVAHSQGAAGPTKQTQHNMPAKDTMTCTEQGYVSPDNNESEIFSKGLQPEVCDVTSE